MYPFVIAEGNKAEKTAKKEEEKAEVGSKNV